MPEIINRADLIKKYINSIYVILSDYTTSAEAKISNSNSGISASNLNLSSSTSRGTK